MDTALRADPGHRRSAFTPKRSLVRSQYRPPAQTPPPDLGRGRLTTGSDNNAGARARALSISYCHGGPLRWSHDQRAAHVVAEGSAGTMRAVAAASGDAPQWRAGPDSASRPRQATDPDRELCPRLRQGHTGPATRQDVPAMTGDERAQGAGRGGSLRGPRRVTAGNGGERRGTARTLPSISRSIGGAACRRRLHSLGNSTPAHSRSPLPTGHGRAAGRPVGSAALSVRPVVVVNVDGPRYEPSQVPAAALAAGGSLFMLGLGKLASAPMSSPRSARRRPGVGEQGGQRVIVGPVLGGDGQPRVLAGAGAARAPVGGRRLARPQ